MINIRKIFSLKLNSTFLEIVFQFIIIISIWFFFFDWRPGSFIFNGDGPASLAWLSYYLENISLGEYYFQPFSLGGSKASFIFGSLASEHIFKHLSLGAENIMSFALFFTQLGFCYCGMRLIEFWDNKNKNLNNHPDLLSLSMGVIFFSFTPVFAWRITAGHLNLLQSLCFVVCCSTLILDVLNEKKINPLYYLFFLALTFPNLGHQLKAYGFIFLFIPVLLSCWIKSDSATKRIKLIKACLFIISCILISSSNFVLMIENFLSKDFVRGLNGESAIYSYYTPGLVEVLKGLALNYVSSLHNVHGFLHHEINYPIGASLLLVVVLFKKMRKLFYFVVLIFFLFLVLSCNISPASTLFLKIFPFLKMFRVPSRLFLLLSTFFTMVFYSYLLSDNRRSATGKKTYLIIFLLVALLYLNNPLVNEIATWIMAVIILFVPTVINKRLFIFGLSVFFFLGFTQRAPKVISKESIARARAKSQAIKRLYPEFNNPLVRTKFLKSIQPFPFSTEVFASVSSVEGYYTPTTYFLDLLKGFGEKRYNNFSTFFTFDPLGDEFNSLAKIYNINSLLDFEGFTIKRITLPATFGEAWFSNEIKNVGTYEDIALYLKNKKMSKDRLIAINPPQIEINDNCSNGRVKLEKFDPKKSKFVFRTEARKFACPLSLSMSFSNSLKASVITTSGDKKELKVFPGYGSIVSMILPNNTRELHIRYTSDLAWLRKLLFYLGLVLLTLLNLKGFKGIFDARFRKL